MNRIEKQQFQEDYRNWKSKVNMSANAIEKYLETEDGKTSGMSRKQVSDMKRRGSNIVRGYDSALAIIRMKRKRVKEWTARDVRWMYRQIDFLTRSIAQEHPYFDEDKNKTRYLKSLLIWGHNPMKGKKVPKELKKNNNER